MQPFLTALGLLNLVLNGVILAVLLIRKVGAMTRDEALQKGATAVQEVDNASVRVATRPPAEPDYKPFGDLFDQIASKAVTIAPNTPPASGDGSQGDGETTSGA